MTIITERVGNIFSAPPGSILIHACNAQGVWGSGVAKAFKQEYPHAYKVYRTHCLQPPSKPKQPPSKPDLSTHQASLVGTTLLITPPATPTPTKTTTSPPTKPKNNNNHWIACLFTSQHYGKKRSAPDVILSNTSRALNSLREQLSDFREGRNVLREIVDENGLEIPGKEGEDELGILGQCYAVRINSGKFGVPWEDTKRVLEGGEVDMVVLRPEGEEGGGGVIGMGGQGDGKERGEGGERGGKVSKKRKVGDWGGDGDGKRETR